MTTETAEDAQRPEAERDHLTAIQGLAALSLDALSSVAYGPEAILVVLVAAGAAGLDYTLPITAAICILLTTLVLSYRQVIAAFPNGGGAYAVSQAHLGTMASLVAAASLIVDYVLNAAVGVSAGIEAITAAYPSLYGASTWLCLGVLALITGLNLWGVSESAKVFTVPTVAFIAAMVAIIAIGLFRGHHPAVVLNTQFAKSTEIVGVLLVLKAFASGCSALTGVEAIANAVPQFRKPRERRAQHTEVWLGILLGGMLIGLGILIHNFRVVPQRVMLFMAVNRSYARIGKQLELGVTPRAPVVSKSLVVVPVGGLSRLTAEGINTALSIGDEVVAVTVCFADPEDTAADVSFRDQWDEWQPDVPLITLRSVHRSLSKPIVSYLCDLEKTDKYHRLFVLIPEVQPSSVWQYLLHNQRGVILDRAIRRHTLSVALCRLRFRLEELTRPPDVS
jgi:hypothetical protein